MTGELRCRAPAETLALAITAARRAGVTRVADVSGFAVAGIPVFQATRPDSRSLAVAQGKGLTPTAAIVGALLEAVEAWTGESLAEPPDRRPLADLPASALAAWSGARDALALDLDPALERAWLPGVDLRSGVPCPIPWDLLSFDRTRPPLEFAASSVGRACGNTRDEALVSGLAEVLEHHGLARFVRLEPAERLARQIALATIDDPLIRQVLRRVEAAGFRVRAWSIGGDAGLPAILCTLLSGELRFDEIVPASGSGCHPSARTAFLRALLEAVQTRAALVAGARDDLKAEDYRGGSRTELAIALAALAFGDGPLAWQEVPTMPCATSAEALALLLAEAAALGGAPVLAFDHAPPCPGLHLAHVFAPGLLLRSRHRGQRSAARPAAAAARARPRLSPRKVLFGGPSLAGLAIPHGIEVREPARCGDLAELVDDPPAAVGLVDGVFKLAPTVWHKEVMGLLARGTRVIGGASLGALRAAELERFGMEGFGAIFALYRSGLIVRDDAVMLAHAPAELGFAALSLPLVDAEYALSLAELPPEARRAMQRIVRRAPFETRTWRGCLARYRAVTGEAFPIAAEALEAAPSLKRIDAQLVVDALAEAHAPVGPATRWPMPPLTVGYRALLASTARASAAGPLSASPRARAG